MKGLGSVLNAPPPEALRTGRCSIGPEKFLKGPARSAGIRHVRLRYRVKVPGSQPKCAATCSKVIPVILRFASRRSARVFGAGLGSYPKKSITGPNRAGTGLYPN